MRVMFAGDKKFRDKGTVFAFVCLELSGANLLKRKPRDSSVAGALFINLPCASLMLLEVAWVANLVRKRRSCRRESRLHYLATRRRGFELRFLFRWCS